MQTGESRQLVLRYYAEYPWFKKDGEAVRYAEYAAAAAGPFEKELGGGVLDGFRPDRAPIGEWDPDLFFLVAWPSWDAFSKLRQSEVFRKIAHLREETLDNSPLIRCSRLAGLGGG